MRINAMSKLTAANRRQTGFIYRPYVDIKHIHLVTFAIEKMLCFMHRVP